jgi:chromate transporter
MNDSILLTLVSHFAGLSLIAFGGASAVVPEMQRLVVEQQHWMTAKEFTDLFAIAQAAPGPNMMIVTLVGWHVAGLAGAILATIAFCMPGAVLAYSMVHLWNRLRDSPWRNRIQGGLLPVTVGLVASTAWLLANSAAGKHGVGIVIAIVCAIIAWRTKLNPLWLLAAGAILGVSGIV